MLRKITNLFWRSYVSRFLIFSLIMISDPINLCLAQNNINVSDKPITFTADEVFHNKELGIIKASGSVEIFNNKNVLLADNISYNQHQDMVTASGNVSLLEPDGTVLFSEYMELSGDFKTAFVENIKIRLSDNARIVANDAQRNDGNRTKLRNGIYSPCNTCAKMTDDPPLWQLKAKKIIHNQKEQELEYYDVWMEMAGIPVMYTPYFQHPDPTVKRKSGFLAPSTGGSTYLGTTFTTPYFYAISPSKDLTVSPTISTNDKYLVSGIYRELYKNGKLDFGGSLAYNKSDDLGGHIKSTAKFDIDERWRWGFNIHRSTDDTHLRRYGFPSSRTLTTKTYAEGFSRRNYLTLEAYSFQGTSIEDNPGKTPLILPRIIYDYQSAIGESGSNTSLNVSSIAMTRKDGNDTRRISVSGGWHLPLIGRGGDITKLSISSRGDLYHVNDLNLAQGNRKYSGFSGRFRPQLKANWRYPLARQYGKISQTIEPIASLIVSPYGGNSQKIPNEDSINLEFDDTNLFSDSIFTGYDRVEGGPRLKYGLKLGLVGSKGGYTTVFIGQRYRPKEDTTFATGSGLEGLLSDFVGRVNVSPSKHLNLTYRSRLDKDNFSFKRNELQINAGPPALVFSSNYIFFEPQSDGEFSGREEISSTISAKLNRFWKSNISSRYDLQGNGDLRNLSLNLTYECECFTLSTSINRQFYQDRDLRPSDSIMFKLSFKTLGDIQSSITNTGIN